MKIDTFEINGKISVPVEKLYKRNKEKNTTEYKNGQQRIMMILTILKKWALRNYYDELNNIEVSIYIMDEP